MRMQAVFAIWLLCFSSLSQASFLKPSATVLSIEKLNDTISSEFRREFLFAPNHEVFLTYGNVSTPSNISRISLCETPILLENCSSSCVTNLTEGDCFLHSDRLGVLYFVASDELEGAWVEYQLSPRLSAYWYYVQQLSVWTFATLLVFLTFYLLRWSGRTYFVLTGIKSVFWTGELRVGLEFLVWVGSVITELHHLDGKLMIAPMILCRPISGFFVLISLNASPLKKRINELRGQGMKIPDDDKLDPANACGPMCGRIGRDQSWVVTVVAYIFIIVAPFLEIIAYLHRAWWTSIIGAITVLPFVIRIAVSNINGYYVNSWIAMSSIKPLDYGWFTQLSVADACERNNGLLFTLTDRQHHYIKICRRYRITKFATYVLLTIQIAAAPIRLFFVSEEADVAVQYLTRIIVDVGFVYLFAYLLWNPSMVNKTDFVDNYLSIADVPEPFEPETKLPLRILFAKNAFFGWEYYDSQAYESGESFTMPNVKPVSCDSLVTAWQGYTLLRAGQPIHVRGLNHQKSFMHLLIQGSKPPEALNFSIQWIEVTHLTTVNEEDKYWLGLLEMHNYYVFLLRFTSLVKVSAILLENLNYDFTKCFQPILNKRVYFSADYRLHFPSFVDPEEEFVDAAILHPLRFNYNKHKFIVGVNGGSGPFINLTMLGFEPGSYYRVEITSEAMLEFCGHSVVDHVNYFSVYVDDTPSDRPITCFCPVQADRDGSIIMSLQSRSSQPFNNVSSLKVIPDPSITTKSVSVCHLDMDDGQVEMSRPLDTELHIMDSTHV